MNGLPVGVFAKTFERDDLGAVLQAVAESGCAAAQFNMVSAGLPTLPDAVPDDVASAVRAAFAAAGVEAAALSGTYNLIHPDEARRRHFRDRLVSLIAAAPAMGFRIVTLCTGTLDPDDQWRAHPENGSAGAWRAMRAELDVLLEAAERAAVVLGIEPELGNVVATPALARRLLGETGAAPLGIVIDPANLEEHPTRASSRAAIGRAFEAVGDRLVLAHGKDRRTDGREAAAGSGAVDFPAYLAALDAANYRGPVVLHGLGEAEVPGAVRFLAAARGAGA